MENNFRTKFCREKIFTRKKICQKKKSLKKKIAEKEILPENFWVRKKLSQKINVGRKIVADFVSY